MQILRRMCVNGNGCRAMTGAHPLSRGFLMAIAVSLSLGFAPTHAHAAKRKNKATPSAEQAPVPAVENPPAPLPAPPILSPEEALTQLEACVRAGDVTTAQQLAAVKLPDSRKATFWRAQAWLMPALPTLPQTEELMASFDAAGEALSRFARAEAALAELADDLTAPLGAEAALSRSAAWASQGDWTRALEALEPLLALDLTDTSAALRQEAQWRTADLRLRTGDPAGAASALAETPESHPRALLLARVALETGNPGEAQRLAAPVAAMAAAGPARATARLVLARARAAAGQVPEAQRSLVEWLRTEPDTPEADAIVLTLEAIGGLATPEIAKVFVEWSAAPQPGLAAAAQFAQAAGQASTLRGAAARTVLLQFAQSHPHHPLAAEARLRAAETALADGDPTAARAALASLTTAGAACPAHLRFRTLTLVAEASRVERDFHAAAEGFLAAGQLAPDQAAARTSFLNAAYCGTAASLGLSYTDETAESAEPNDENEVTLTPSEGPLAVEALVPTRYLHVLTRWPDAIASVLYESGLLAAARQRTVATDFLQRFLEISPTDPRRAEAATALAELCLLEPPPDLRRARKWVRTARKAKPAAATRERLDWLELWIEEKDSAYTNALEKADAFLTAWPSSPRRPWVRLRRALWRERLGQWPAAVAEYTALAETENEEGDLDEIPLSMAARAAYLAGLAELRLLSPDSLDLAIDHWSTAAQLDESVAFAARLQQALAKSRLGQHEEALRQLEALLTGPPALTPARRTAVLLAQGELYLRPSAPLPTPLQRACAAFAQVAEDPAAPAAQRAQALCRQGDALRLLGQKEAAFDLYQRAAAPLLTGGVLLPPATAVWPARAGLSAVALLEERQEWTAAAALAQQLAATPGSHAVQAREKAARLRLEHFLWE